MKATHIFSLFVFLHCSMPFLHAQQLSTDHKLIHGANCFLGMKEVYTYGFSKEKVITGNGARRRLLAANIFCENPVLDIMAAKGTYFRFDNHNYLVTDVYREGRGRSVQGYLICKEVYPLPENIRLLNGPQDKD
ncbi:MAG: hypothetical protein IPN95_04990 [Bacteroidetes bacterium]|nr:hypothetical protein [Bacteroidota bacterium]